MMLAGHPSLALSATLLLLIAAATDARGEPAAKPQLEPAKKTDAADWKPLFDGKTMNGWKLTQFGGEGEVQVEKGHIVMQSGYSMTGITFQKDFPKTGYELRLEAARLKGNDFFCGLTFPVNQSHCSFIVGGWAGAVVGLSSIDDKDASENATTRYMAFKTGQWYRIRVRVTPDRIRCWIDDKQVVDQDIRGRKISLRNEVDLSKPLGICAWETESGLRKIEYRILPAKAAVPRR